MTIRPIHTIVLAAALGGCLDPNDPGNLVPKTVDQDPSLPQIEIAGTKLHAEAFGDPGDPLVIALHGGPGGDYRAMLQLRDLAAQGYRVVFFDQRGTGLSQRHDADHYTTEGYLEDLRLVIEHYTVRADQPLVFIGHSWGAMYATWFINEYGTYNGRIKGAILSEPGAFNRDQLDRYMDAVEAEFSLTGEQLHDGLWSRQFMSPADHARADYLSGVMSLRGLPSEVQDPNNPRPIWRDGAVVSKALLELVVDGFDWTTNLAAFQTHVLFLRGELNKVVTYEHQAELAAAYPSSEIITIRGVGHEVIWETGDEYLVHTTNYFNQIKFAGDPQ